MSIRIGKLAPGRWIPLTGIFTILIVAGCATPNDDYFWTQTEARLTEALCANHNEPTSCRDSAELAFQLYRGDILSGQAERDKAFEIAIPPWMIELAAAEVSNEETRQVVDWIKVLAFVGAVSTAISAISAVVSVVLSFRRTTPPK